MEYLLCIFILISHSSISKRHLSCRHFWVFFHKLLLHLETSFSWDTKSIPDGSNNLIKVVAECSEGATSQDVSDNIFTVNNANNTTNLTSTTETTSSISNSTKSSSSSNPLNNIIVIGGAVIGLGIVGSVSTVFILRKRSKK